MHVLYSLHKLQNIFMYIYIQIKQTYSFFTITIQMLLFPFFKWGICDSENINNLFELMYSANIYLVLMPNSAWGKGNKTRSCTIIPLKKFWMNVWLNLNLTKISSSWPVTFYSMLLFLWSSMSKKDVLENPCKNAFK